MKVGCRYCDSQTGTFTSRDTYLDQKPYLYCEHDPVNAVDPSGHNVWEDIFTVLSFGGGAVTTVCIPNPWSRLWTVVGFYPAMKASGRLWKRLEKWDDDQMQRQRDDMDRYYKAHPEAYQQLVRELSHTPAERNWRP